MFMFLYYIVGVVVAFIRNTRGSVIMIAEESAGGGKGIFGLA